MAPPTRFTADNNDTMQKYMALSSKEESIRRRMSLQNPTTTAATAPAAGFQSLSTSPVQSQSTFTSPWSSEPEYTSTDPIPTTPGVAHRHSIAGIEDAHKLCELNQEIKATLTELLNTESIRSDGKSRAWVQSRLMSAEHQLRQQKRRRSSGSNTDKEFASSIAEHMDMGMCRTWG